MTSPFMRIGFVLAVLVLVGCSMQPTIQVTTKECPTTVTIDDSVLELLSASRGEDDLETMWCSLAQAKVSKDTLDFMKYDNGGARISMHEYVKSWQQDDSLEGYTVADLCKRIANTKSLKVLFDLVHD